MLAAVVLSLCVHAAGLLVLTRPPSNPPPTTDIVGESDTVVLGLDLAMTDPPPTPPTLPVPAPPEPAPALIPEPTPPTPEPAPAQADAAPAEPPPEPNVAILPQPDAPAAKVPIELPTPKPSFAISIEAPPSAPPAAPAPPKHATPEPPPEVRPIAAFAGVKADRAKRVVYAVDISGVMVGSLPFVLEELKRCVNRLGPDQEFQVVLFRDPTPPAGSQNAASSDASQGSETHDPAFDGDKPESTTALPPLEDLYPSALWLGQAAAAGKASPPSLLRVDEDSRKQLATLVGNLQSDGASNPLTGLRLALSMKPDVVFLLTRGIRRSGTSWGPGERQVMLALDEANPKDASGRRATTIRTIQFVAKDPSGLMDLIAKEHGGGTATVLTVADLKAASKATKR
jgi:hypothetical protein